MRRFAEHREWMLRSVALSFVIVANRVWVPLCVVVLAPGSIPGRSVPDPAAFAQAAGVAAWLGLVVNVLFVEWWLHHTRFRKPSGRVRDRREDLADRVDPAMTA
jgi:hypothetical protein